MKKLLKLIIPATYAKLEAENKILLKEVQELKENKVLLKEIQELKEKNALLEQKLDVQTVKILNAINRLAEEK